MRVLPSLPGARVARPLALLTVAAFAGDVGGARPADAQPAAAPAAPPQNAPAVTAAVAVARAALAALNAGKFDSIAALVDPRLLNAARARAVESARVSLAYRAREDSIFRGQLEAKPGEFQGAWGASTTPPPAVRA